MQRDLSNTEDVHGAIAPASSPSVEGCRPEIDPTPLLNEEGHREFQSLIRMLNLMVEIGRTDMSFAASSLARFSVSTREGHLARSLRTFPYLKKRPNLEIAHDPTEIEQPHDRLCFNQEHLRRNYQHAVDEKDPGFPKPRHKNIPVATCYDANLVHDAVTR